MLVRFSMVLLLLLTVGTVCRAQAFPLRPGDWEDRETSSTAGGAPQVLHFCMNDETWLKVIQGNATCTNQDLKITSTGAHYVASCTSAMMSIKGPVEMTFDGKEHMTAKMQMTMTIKGKTMESVESSDFHWKAATCDGTEANMRKLRR